MPLKLGDISPESELQQNLEQLNVTEKDGHKHDDGVHVVEGESTNYDKGKDRKTTSDNNINNEKKWSDETTCHSEDGSHEIGPNITNDNDKDKDYNSSADESDFSLPKHRKDCPSDDDGTDSEPFTNEEDENDSEDSSYRLVPQQKSSSETYTPYEQITPIKLSNTLQVNGTNVPFEVSPMSLGDNSLQDNDLDIARIVNPILRRISDLKSELRTQLAKVHYCPNPNLDEVKVDENWQHTEFEEPQDQYCYNTIATAGKLLDIIMPMQLPEEAKEHLAKARRILLKKASLCRTTSETINLSSSSISRDADPTSATTSNDTVKSGTVLDSSNTNKINKSSGSPVQAESSGENSNQTSVEVANKAEDQTNKESSNNHNVTNPHKYRRGTTQGRKLRRHSARSSSYPSPKSGRRSQHYSPRTPSSRSPRVGSTVTSSIAGSATQANNRRFVGFLPSRCFTCGGIGHFASNCPNKGSYITTSTGNNQQSSRSRRRPNINRYKRTTESIANNSTSN
ncbi:hypothetical protein RclHR1_01330016 [Rhizophagus clarus]|uniref:CCHC-type domain-containing protein n=1 Tax=Rhizophagus clarus TaxID=94130 RepID=A0A2Z6QE64_9GLOM|nr:hypothetical protein RclHR1_01330016 [Rhizophagus clarus]GES79883.1 hypothetical protein GLOIN_2v1536474 [Rhizophagus clarus]